MSNTGVPAVFVQENQPDWGSGILLEEKDGKMVLLFERGGRRVFNKLLVKGLKPAEMSGDEARALDARLRGRPLKASSAKPAKKAKLAAAPPTSIHGTFEVQLRSFEAHFTGGFEGETFLEEERGRPGLKGKKGYKAAAIAFAQEQLSPERFETTPPEELFEAARKALQFTNIVHPMEGAIAFGSVNPEERALLMSALKELLHGTGEYTARFERFVSTVNITDAKGKAKPVTWPVATLFSALYHPTAHVAVKPTAFALQAPLVGLAASKSQPVTGAAYARFLEIALATQQRLIAAGHTPRDLMDVYTFIWWSQEEKKAPKA